MRCMESRPPDDRNSRVFRWLMEGGSMRSVRCAVSFVRLFGDLPARGGVLLAEGVIGDEVVRGQRLLRLMPFLCPPRASTSP